MAKKSIVNIANSITLIRFLLLFYLIYLIYIDSRIKVFLLFISIWILDGFDGYFARKLHQETVFGKYFDMITDSLLISIIAFAYLSPIYALLTLGIKIPSALRKPHNEDIASSRIAGGLVNFCLYLGFIGLDQHIIIPAIIMGYTSEIKYLFQRKRLNTKNN